VAACLNTTCRHSTKLVSVLQVEACNTDTTQTQPHQISNTQRTENNTTDVVIQQHSCKLLMMDILMSETCWAHTKWNKIASDIKLVFYSSTITMMHGPINVRFSKSTFQFKPARLRTLLINAIYCVTRNMKTKKTVFKKRLYLHHNFADTKTELHNVLPSQSQMFTFLGSLCQ